MRSLILLGAPGSGKGTFSKLLVERLKWKHFSVGDELREEIRAKSEFGEQVSKLVSSGKLVSDDIINAFVSSRIRDFKHDEVVIFDGYPRTPLQCNYLHDSHQFNDIKAVHIELPEWVIVKKILGRRKCHKCNQDYNLSDIRTDGFDMPPLLPTSQTCPHQHKDCMEKYFTSRPDDAEHIIAKRIHDYNLSISFLLEYYQKMNALSTLHVKKGVADIDELIKLVT